MLNAFLNALKGGESHGTRAPQRVEVYQKLYAEKVKVEMSKRHTDNNAERMRIRREVTNALLDSEEPEVQQQVDDVIKRWQERHEARKKSGGSENGAERSPEEYQR